MPTPARTSLDDIVVAGRAILASHGLAALTMQSVADRVGVRAPSLYKRVRNREDLVRLIASSIAADLGRQLEEIVNAGQAAAQPDRQLEELVRSVRRFALETPDEYRLVFAPLSESTRADVEALATAVEPLITVTTRLVGVDHALDAARTVTAWGTGFVAMELAGAFRLGGAVEEAFEFGLGRIVAALNP